MLQSTLTEESMLHTKFLKITGIFVTSLLWATFYVMQNLLTFGLLRIWSLLFDSVLKVSPCENVRRSLGHFPESPPFFSFLRYWQGCQESFDANDACLSALQCAAAAFRRRSRAAERHSGSSQSSCCAGASGLAMSGLQRRGHFSFWMSTDMPTLKQALCSSIWFVAEFGLISDQYIQLQSRAGTHRTWRECCAYLKQHTYEYALEVFVYIYVRILAYEFVRIYRLSQHEITGQYVPAWF